MKNKRKKRIIKPKKYLLIKNTKNDLKRLLKGLKETLLN